MLPLAPGANGQPPSPPTDESSRRDARGDGGVGAGQSGAAGVVEVRAERQVADRSGRSSSISAVTRRGVVVPMVSAMAIRSTPISTAAVTMSSTRARIGRPVERAVPRRRDDDLDRRVAARGRCGRCRRSGRWTRRSTGRRWRWLCPSAADTTYSIEPMPAAIARPAPPGPATSAENSTPCDCAEAGQFGGQRRGVGQRGHLRRRHEGGRLDLADPGGDDGLEQFELGGQRDRVLDLQAVAQADLADGDVARAGRSQHPLRPQRVEFARRSGRAARRRPRRCAARASASRRCGWCPASRTAPAPRPAP